MDAVRSAVLCVCAAAVVGSALRLLCPEGPLKRVYRAAVAAFLLCAILSAVTQTDFSAAAAEVENALAGQGVTSGESMTAAFGEQVAGQFADRLSREIGDALVQAGFVPENIFVRAYYSKEEGIRLEQITVSMPVASRAREAEIKLCVQRIAGVLPEVYYAG